ncbi:MAG TPA: tRNA (adenosine(37)-N6)-threonylcarbamoyltransferase complex transferase subunit TsaD [Syntrophomonadaceae bacterium]|nr:tRNA (adenosine(37)-N6)-threonylcarbamoyltransferase complex transferase subunit TsaD [Syntrophomonadaceae bacterium]
MNDVIILGIETSCDETAAALVLNGREILANVVNSQVPIHQEYGGVVPEIASRQHVENIARVVDLAFAQAGIRYADIQAVAVTNRPGLIGALLVGLSFAKGFAYALDKPLIAVNHLEGHIYANILEHPELEFPAVCLVVSGGHTSILYMPSASKSQLLGETRDDAAGEAFDKVARFLQLGYPGGPAIQQAAEQGQAGQVKLPRVFLDRADFEFSFSGLKTAAMNLWKKLEKNGEANVYNLAAEFQAALVDVLVDKTLLAAQKFQVKSILLAGGVAANAHLRKMMKNTGEAHGFPVYYPSLNLCTDNGAMIAGNAYISYVCQDFSALSLNAYPGLSSL